MQDEEFSFHDFPFSKKEGLSFARMKPRKTYSTLEMQNQEG
ncbi:hypothetical protein SCG7109_AB_00110 [Chlamydiales bacterium SCGC AG-110-M15]|nr:hypothetical protein SCG7109_AB_00110 [Chlamydiales bacterium SCGC AG-110-M15]